MPATGDGSPVIRILSLGDSYTIGEAVGGHERWPMQLAAQLRVRGLNAGAPTIVARTGWTTDELSAALDAAEPEGPYDLVTLLIGVNNQYRGRSSDEYRDHFRALLDRAVGYAASRAARVIVLSIPDWGATPFAEGRDRARIGTELDELNAIAREETEQVGARFVDITPISRRAADDEELVASDGLHPSGAMYGEWTSLVLPVAIEALGSPERD